MPRCGISGDLYYRSMEMVSTECHTAEQLLTSTPDCCAAHYASPPS